MLFASSGEKGNNWQQLTQMELFLERCTMGLVALEAGLVLLFLFLTARYTYMRDRLVFPDLSLEEFEEIVLARIIYITVVLINRDIVKLKSSK